MLALSDELLADREAPCGAQHRLLEVGVLESLTLPANSWRVEGRSGASTGGVYRVVDFLERQDLLAREPRKQITRVDWRQTSSGGAGTTT